MDIEAPQAFLAGGAEGPRIGLAGFGTVGQSVGRAITTAPEIGSLVGIAARDAAKARRIALEIGIRCPVASVEDVVRISNVIVEAAPVHAFREIMEASLLKGRTVIICSTIGLAEAPDLIDLARDKGARILVPSCSIPGVDALVAAAQGKITSARIVTRKPYSSLPAHRADGQEIRSTTPSSAVCLFAGPAREAIRLFPANVNVAATVALAGIGLDSTTVEIWADPAIDRNTHQLWIDADSTQFSVEVSNVPDARNPKTGLLTANGVIALLRKFSQTVVFGI